MASLTRFQPLEDLFNDITRGFWVKPVTQPGGQELNMKLEVKETDKAYTVHAEVPGAKKEEIQVDVSGAYVSIRAEVKQEKQAKEGEKTLHSERYYGLVSRSFSLPDEIDDKAVEAKYKDGVLDLVLPKKQASGGRRIAVQ